MSPPQQQPYRVLVIEDNSADAELVKLAFSECGYSCQLTFTQSHSAAGQLLAEQSFDLLVSDFGADEGALSRFVQSVRTQHSCLPIVVLSGYADPNPAYRSGANAFVRKSGNLEQFFAKIQGVMRFWIDVAELPSPRRVRLATGI